LKKRLALWSGLGVGAFLGMIGGAWIVSLPSAPVDAAEPPIIAKEEDEATIAALKPPKRRRPLIAIIGINHATETTDYLMPMAFFGGPTSPMWSRWQPSRGR
jgi:hypothetical protein